MKLRYDVLGEYAELTAAQGSFTTPIAATYPSKIGAPLPISRSEQARDKHLLIL